MWILQWDHLIPPYLLKIKKFVLAVTQNSFFVFQICIFKINSCFGSEEIKLPWVSCLSTPLRLGPHPHPRPARTGPASTAEPGWGRQLWPGVRPCGPCLGSLPLTLSQACLPERSPRMWLYSWTPVLEPPGTVPLGALAKTFLGEMPYCVLLFPSLVGAGDS